MLKEAYAMITQYHKQGVVDQLAVLEFLIEPLEDRIDIPKGVDVFVLLLYGNEFLERKLGGQVERVMGGNRKVAYLG